MSGKPSKEAFSAWLDVHMVKSERNVPARLLTLLGLLERLRDTPTMDLISHRAPSGAQLIEHNGFVDAALARFKVESPVQEKGRRANNLNAWTPPLFEWLAANGFVRCDAKQRDEFLTALQSVAAARLVTINEDKPLVARYNKGTSIAVIIDILDQAQAKKRAKDVAEYLVGAKLEIRYGNGVVEPKHVNAPSLAKLADFRVGNAAIEVTIAERADKSHLDQVKEILKNTGLEIWLLTRLKDREKWQIGIDAVLGATEASRVAVVGIEAFVGQNISEIGKFDPDKVKKTLAALFARYADAWLPRFGAGGLRIVDPEAGAE
ncbi:MAG TPA: DUF4928 family protein [Tepidisphaeraceae bacterium]|jgi:hypothetical protein|nr:DUF4928 family protein [Tepidisphaeraceae bacterium]